MKRAFSQLSSRLLKNSESEDLQSTIRFLTRGSKPSSTLSSLLDRRGTQNGILSGHKEDQEDSKHVERILNILNSTLPEVESKKKRVEAHYEILFSQLKNIVERSIEATAFDGKNAGISELKQSSLATNAVARTISSEGLYDKIMILQYTNQLTTVGQMARIILSKNFKEFDKLWENISFFNEKQRLDLTVLLYYRCEKREIREQYEAMWFTHYRELHSTIQRLLWRCVTRGTGSDNYARAVGECVERIKSWGPNDTVIVYQSLYAKSHLLPETLFSSTQKLLSKNQELFIQTLRILAAYDIGEKRTQKWMVKLVKLSIENKLSVEKAHTSQGISIYQYRFIRALDLAVQEIYSSCEGKKSLLLLQRDLEKILRSANDEEQEVKSQMSLKFI